MDDDPVHGRPALGLGDEAMGPSILEDVFSAVFRREASDLIREIRVGGQVVSTCLPHAGSNDDDLGTWWRAYLAGRRPLLVDEQDVDALRTVELFCGSGGLALGFAQACAELGLAVISEAAADQDRGALDVYRANHGTRVVTTSSVSTLVDHAVDRRGDGVRWQYAPELVDADWVDLIGNIDVVLAGPPCEGHSNLNNKTRRTDNRNELYLTVPAIAVALRAPVVIIENVPGVVHDRLGVIAATISLLERAGYWVEVGNVQAACLGWPQNRDRFFVVARREMKPLPLGLVAAALSAPPKSLWWAISDLEHPERGDPLVTLPELSAENRRRIAWLFDHDEYDLPLSERPECHREGTTYNSVYGRLYAERPAPTITTGFMTPGRGRYIHPTQRRVITPREAARLQAFPDSYDFTPDRLNPPSKAQLGKWIGDAVPMPLGHAATMAALGPGLARLVR
jgi:DNA (cytosine-5)-methyltransferase 1